MKCIGYGHGWIVCAWLYFEGKLNLFGLLCGLVQGGWLNFFKVFREEKSNLPIWVSNSLLNPINLESFSTVLTCGSCQTESFGCPGSQFGGNLIRLCFYNLLF